MDPPAKMRFGQRGLDFRGAECTVGARGVRRVEHDGKLLVVVARSIPDAVAMDQLVPPIDRDAVRLSDQAVAERQ
jgi:hypothetical protein